MRKVHAFTCIEKLRFVPWPYRLHFITSGKTWGEAINIGLAQTDPANDVILMDDDVFINADTFSKVEEKFQSADIFGFKLVYPDNRIQHMGGIVRAGMIGHIGHNEIDEGQWDVPLYTCHATTSLVYIKRNVLNAIGGIAENFPGIQMDDVDFSFRAIKAGFKIMVLPQSAIHLHSASKKFLPNFEANTEVAFQEVKKRHFHDPRFVAELERYPKKQVELILA